MPVLPQLNIPLHVKYIQDLGTVSPRALWRSKQCARYTHSQSSQNKDDLTYHLTAHLRMNAIYWGLTALCVMKHKDALDREEMIAFVMSCWDDEAGPSTPRFSSLKRTMAHIYDRYRWVRCTSTARRAPPAHAQRDTDPHNPGCAGPHRHQSRHEVSVRSLHTRKAISDGARRLQSSCRFNSRRVCSPATNTARSTRVSYTAGSTRLPCSDGYMSSISRKPWIIFDSARTLTAGSAQLSVRKATQRKVSPPCVIVFEPCYVIVSN